MQSVPCLLILDCLLLDQHSGGCGETSGHLLAMPQLQVQGCTGRSLDLQSVLSSDPGADPVALLGAV